MGKAEKGSAKYIANRIKAKGLQKLRWYCQMCQKQCRDENGFKCHTTSESHQRQLLLFADNASHYIDGFSREFRDGYLELLRRQFGTRRVSANKVYQDYIGNREHVHMNATQWETLTEFVKWLGREGKCVVDETEKGWFVTYIDREPAALAAAEARAKRDKCDRDDQERMLRFVERQVARGREELARGREGQAEEAGGPSELRRAEGQERLSLTLSLKRRPLDQKAEPLASSALAAPRAPATKRRKREEEASARPSALQDIIAAEESARERANRKEHWVCAGIVVKVVGGELRGRKAVVQSVRDRLSATLRLLDSGDTHTLHQSSLETVIPRSGRRVRFVNGAYRTHVGTLAAIHADRYCCDVEISSGPLRGRLVTGVQYEDICKLAEE